MNFLKFASDPSQFLPAGRMSGERFIAAGRLDASGMVPLKVVRVKRFSAASFCPLLFVHPRKNLGCIRVIQKITDFPEFT
jgi:hypothetical protein